MATKKIVKKTTSKKTVFADHVRLARYVLVRTYSAGVHFGQLTARAGEEVELSNARRIWDWKGANTLNEIANHGVKTGSRVSEAVTSNILTGAIEIIACTPEAVANLSTAKWGT